jgi:hypothetical protein
MIAFNILIRDCYTAPSIAECSGENYKRLYLRIRTRTARSDTATATANQELGTDPHLVILQSLRDDIQDHL